ncbi:major facilitator superfamily domain-containing protein [Leptodontidium sp. 2 PMI_412]|nr:major facilitator superfamily domain-containing protein [Leptodontidium sp. 2 PMI_412]
MFLHSHRDELTSSNALQSLDVGEKSGTTTQSFNYELESTTASPRILSDIDELGLRLVEDGFVRWKPDATGHPRNWGLWRKAFDSGVILMLDLFTTAVSTAGLSVAEIAKDEYGLSRVTALVAFGSMYQFGQAIGGVIFPPYSEAAGRRAVYISAASIYSLSCIFVGFVPGIYGAVVGRFISGFVSAVPSIVVSGSLEDMFNMNNRVWLMYAWACATTGGLLIGPIYGSYIAAALGWRWVFHIAAIITGIFAFLLLFIKESRPSRLLSQRLATLQGNGEMPNLRINNPDHTPDFQTFAKVALRRPIRLFFTDPIVFLVSIMSAVGWALIYLFTESLPVIYAGFGFSRKESSLLFLAILVGIFFGIFPRMQDWRVLKQRKLNGQPLHPEDKLVGFIYAAPCLAFGLWWLTLTVPPASNLPWYASIIGLVPIGFATNEFACTLSGYLADTYTIYASSAFAAMSFFRAILGGVFPLIGEPMYVNLGSNWATVVLACIASLFCATPILFLKFGKQIRQRSKFAKYSLRVNNETQVEDDNME